MTVVAVLPDSPGQPGALARLDALLHWTPSARVVLVDPDGAFAGIVGDRDEVQVAASLRAVLELAEDDLAVVASGTEVGPGWLGGLRRAAADGELPAGAVEANDQTGQPWPAHLGWPDICRALARADLPIADEARPGAGRCVYLPPATVEHFRAAGVTGWSELWPAAAAIGPFRCAPRVPVRGSAVHGAAAPELRAAVVAELAAVRDRLRAVDGVRPLRAYVTGAGTATAIDLAANLAMYQDSLVVSVDGGHVEAGTVERGRLTPSRAWDGDARSIADFLIRAGAESVHLLPGPAAAMPVDLETEFERVDLPTISGFELVADISGLRPVRNLGSRAVGPLRILGLVEADTDLVYVQGLATRLGPGVEWHLLGAAADEPAGFGVEHGAHRRDLLARVVAEIDPDLSLVVGSSAGLVPAGLNQSWALGVPVLVRDGSAAAEHVRESGGGLVLPADLDAAAAIVRTADDGTLDRVRREVPRAVVPHLASLERYREQYESMVTRAPRVRVGYVMQGALGRHGSCQHLRVLQRLTLIPPAARMTARQIYPAEVLAGVPNLDVLLVQRDGLADLTDDALAATRVAGLRVAFEIDDDLMHVDAAHRMSVDTDAHERMAKRLVSVARSAGGSLVTTEDLARRVQDLAGVRSTVVPNDLDPRVWLRDVETQAAPPGDQLRVLYMGSSTHLEDLFLLKPALEAARQRLGRDVVLEIIGIAGAFEGDDWVIRRPVPASARNYPDFIPWLRARRLRWTAAVAPLVDTEFNRCKSDLKLLEYALLDLPVVASDVGPYRGREHLALLTPNDAGSWSDALTACLADPDAAKARAQAAREHVLTHRMLSPERAGAWLETVLG